jgi:hypothetical protein
MNWSVRRDTNGFVAVLSEKAGRMVEEVNRMEGFATAQGAWEAIAEREGETPSSMLD